MVIAYMAYFSLKEAYNYVRRQQPRIKPSHHFIQALIRLDFKLFQKNSVSTEGYEYVSDLFYDDL